MSLRFGVVCSDTTIANWQAHCIREIVDAGRGELACVIVCDESENDTPRGASKRPQRSPPTSLWDLYQTLYVSRRSYALRPADIRRTAESARVIRGSRARIASALADVPQDLDFLLNFTDEALQDEVAESLRHGTWHFDYGNDGSQRTPPGFQELLTGRSIAPARLIRGNGRKHEVLHAGRFPTFGHSYARTVDDICMGAAAWPARVCAEISMGRCSGDTEARPFTSDDGLPTRPTGGQTARLLLRLARAFIGIQVRALFRTHQWNIGLIEAPITSFLAQETKPAIRWLPPPSRGTFVADPFPIERDGRLTLLVEVFEYASWRGRIAMLEVDRSGASSAPVTVLDPGTHASYPYTFEHAGDVYCIPETGAAREIVLYRAVEWPKKWEKVTTLLADVAALDPTVVRFGEYWWLFFTDFDLASNSNLYAWYAPNLLGPWSPHACNPLKTDVTSSRPAGTPFVHEGDLYRPSQDCSDMYGSAVVFNRVLRLSPTEFEEEVAGRLEPDPNGPYPAGVHTVAGCGDITVVDGNRWAFSRQAFRRELTTRLGRLRRRPDEPSLEAWEARQS